MPKMTDAGKDHRHIALIGGGDYFFIAHRTARLNCTAGTGISRCKKPIRKWEKCITGEGAVLEGKARFLRFPDCDPRRIDARHLPGADGQSAIRPGVNDGI